MSLNLRQIEVFRAIMITGSISGAARLLSVSQPAISRLLAYTEDRLKLKLFERVKGRVQPTPEARRLFAEVDQVHQGVLRVNEIAEELRRRGTGSVRIVASPSIGEAIIPTAVARFRASYPDVRIEIEILTLTELVAKVGANRVDLGLSVLPVDEPTVFSSQIAEGRLMVICPKGHELAALKAVKVADLAPFPLIGYGSQTPYGIHVERALRSSRAPVRINTQVRFTPQACALVQAGAGIAIVDEFVLSGRTWPDIVARPLVPKTTMRVHLLSSRLEPMSHIARAFVHHLRQLFGSPPPATSQGEDFDVAHLT